MDSEKRPDLRHYSDMDVVFETLAGIVLQVAYLNAASLAGFVHDPTGAPPPRAYVMLAHSTGQAKLLRTVTTEDGSFSFQGLVPGDYSIRVEADGFVGVRRHIRLTLDEDRRLSSPIVLDVEGHGGCWYDIVAPHYEVKGSSSTEVQVSGQITGSRKRRSNISASVAAPESDVSRSTVTDRQGRYKLVIPMAGVIQLQISTPGKVKLRSALMPTNPGDRVLVSPIRIPNPIRKPRWWICE